MVRLSDVWPRARTAETFTNVTSKCDDFSATIMESARRSSMSRRLGYVALFSFLVWAIPAFSQEFRASITGQVTDPSGAPVPNARVVVLNIERNVTSEAISNSTGRYLVQFLYPCSYAVSVDHPGFKPFTQRGLNLQAADHISLERRVEIGA